MAIGNSITKHEICDYWWGEWGMAASEQHRDYFHQLVDGLQKSFGDVNAGICPGYMWEYQSHDRAESLEIMDGWLVSGVDLVTIQLSENVANLSTFETDFQFLILHVQERCGSECQIVIIDDFWSDEKSEIKAKVAKELEVDFVDLSDIRGKTEYQVGMGTKVQGIDSEEHAIEHSGVAAHPGDLGMRIIAQRVLEKVRK